MDGQQKWRPFPVAIFGFACLRPFQAQDGTNSADLGKEVMTLIEMHYSRSHEARRRLAKMADADSLERWPWADRSACHCRTKLRVVRGLSVRQRLKKLRAEVLLRPARQGFADAWL